jgi:hypothetical protein
LRATTVWQGGDVPTLALLAQQLIDEGFMDAEQLGDFTSGSDAAFDGVNYTFTKV